MSDAMSQYHDALRDRRHGGVSDLGPDANYLEVKPDFYADSRVLAEEALQVYRGFQDTHPPYGLVDRNGVTMAFDDARDPWMQLAMALRATGHAAMEQAIPPVDECPYSAILAAKLAPTIPPLAPFDNEERGLDTLRAVATPGAELNAPLFVSLIQRLPEIQHLFGSTTDPEEFALNSVSLLREPLGHPQQWAAPFVYSLGNLRELLTPDFLCDELAGAYTRVEHVINGGERLAWAIPTEDFTLRQDYSVLDRVAGSELDRTNVNSQFYPAGTRLGDIEVTEPVIGCPGNLLAYAMWDTTVTVAAREGFWDL